LDEKDARFLGLRGTRDCVACMLREEGVGCSVKHAEVISQAEEDLLWSSEVMGLHSLKALFHTIFFLNGKTLCLRGGHEHKNLKISQFSVWVVEILCIM
jgi:hypothetical protein